MAKMCYLNYAIDKIYETLQCYFYINMGHAATKPDKVNILLCDMNERLIVMWL